MKKGLERYILTFIVGSAGLFMLSLTNANADSVDQFERIETIEFDVSDQGLVLRNLAGSVQIKPTSDDVATIEATVIGQGSNGEKHAEMIKFEQNERNGNIELRTLYPVEDYSRFVYDSEAFRGNYNTSLKYQGRKVRVSNKRGFREGFNAYVDFVVYLPKDASFKLTNAVGPVEANAVSADLDLDTHSGSIVSTKGDGSIRLDTGSGRIKVNTHDGNVDADTGSGGIVIEKVSGNVRADTGSGGVDLIQIDGDADVDTGSGSIDVTQINGSLKADTGSGSVDIDTANGSLWVDTGSGSVRAKDLIAGAEVDVDTGSGRVSLEGDLGAVSKLNVDTGSGSIKLMTTQMPSMRLSASSNSSVEVDFPSMSDVRASRGNFRGTLGGGQGRGSLETGSGSITFSLR